MINTHPHRLGSAEATAGAGSGSKAATVIDAGEAVVIQTPTAGGYGDPRG
jgi:N-methylhydantoinase B/oxoprolinase/acetone carboxylase alpha subunit